MVRNRLFSSTTKSETAFFRMRSHLCWHYLSSRQVALQVLSTRMSLTSVFGMGTGGPSPQSIPTMWMGVTHLCICQSAPRSNSLWIIAPFCFPVNPCFVSLTKSKPSEAGLIWKRRATIQPEYHARVIWSIVSCARSW